MRRLYFYLIACCAFSLTACSAGQKGLLDFLEVREPGEHRVEISHPGGPIQEPEVPEELLKAARENPDLRKKIQGKVHYKVKHEFSGAWLDKKFREEISDAFEKASLLEKLRKQVPVDFPGLEQRARADMSNALDVLHAYGFYEGEVSAKVSLVKSKEGKINPNRAEVLVTFVPGPRYNLGKSEISVSGIEAGAEQILDSSGHRTLPRSLDDIGLPEGESVQADVILDAVDALRDLFRSRGYPYATIKSARYFLDREEHLLEVEVEVDSGDKVLMGDFELRGLSPVRPKYFENMQNWLPGRPWNQERLDIYRENLRQTGLFASVELKPSEVLNERGERNVVVEVIGSLERTVGGAVRYDSDLGPGVLGYWEHRNITGRGDKLRVEVPIWEEMQELALSYRLPFFKRRDQDLLISGGVLHEDNDSYKLFTGNGAIGIERRLGRHWSGTARVRGEGGQIEEVDKKERDYYMFGLPLSLTFDDTKSLLDATKGVRITLAAAPYGGSYEDYFSALRTRLDAHFFLPLIKDESLVLALRGTYGSLFLADSDEVPPTIRFYSGGGGSVRGYDYRSIGPRNENDDPLGGDSLVECSAELRFRFAKDWGLVLFSDGGMVYTDKVPSKDENLLWGAGIGLRYHTMLGPVRFDVAFPLNKRDDDSSVQLYISIGQSF